MGRFRARDLGLVPNLISLTRVPLAVIFPLAVGQPTVALLVLVAAALSDVVDGWYARRYRQATPTGTVVDPITDKLFVASVAATLMVTGRLSLLGLLLLATREIGELPLLAWWVVSRRRRRARAETPAANLPGKLGTALQFAAVAACLFELDAFWPLLIATAQVGWVAALVYWVREVGAVRAGSTP